MSVETGEDISAKLEEAIAGDVETPATEEEEVETSERSAKEEKPANSKAVPYARFKEVIETKNTLQEQLDALTQEHKETSDSLTRMTKMLDESKDNTKLIGEIQALHNDPRYKGHVEAIDRALRGIEDEIEETGDVDDKTVDKTASLLKKEQEKLSQELFEHRTQLLVDRADQTADRWLDALPEQYTDQDKAVLARLWAQEVDFDQITDVDGLNSSLHNSFQKIIDDFGIPRGGLIDPNDEESYEIEIDEPETITPEQEIAEIVKGRNYASFKDGIPEVSDDEYAADMAKVMRATRK